MTILQNYLKVYGNELVSEKSLKYFLPLIYPSIVKEISIRKLSAYYDIELDEENLKSKRFDFTSLNEKLIIEFDGEQHFKHIDYFGSYRQFIKLQSTDFLKHKFIKQNKFNLIRITGKLTLQELFDLIKNIKFNINDPKVVFIENNQINVIDLKQLNDLPTNTELLQTNLLDLSSQLKFKDEKLLNLENQILELKNQINLLNNQTSEPKNQITNTTSEDSWTYEFVKFVEDAELCGLFNFKVIPTAHMSKFVKYYLTENNESMLIPSSQTINKELEPLMKKHGYKLSSKNNMINVETLDKLDYNMKFIQDEIYNNIILPPKSKTRYWYKDKSVITKEDHENFLNNYINKNYKELDVKEKIIVKYYIDMRNMDIISWYESSEKI